MISVNPFQQYTPNFQGGINPEKISYPVKRQTDLIVSILGEATPNVRKLRKAVHNSGAQSALEKLKEITGIDVIFEDGLSFICGDKKIKVFTSGDKLRIKEQNVKNRRIYLDVELNGSEVQYAKGFTPKSGTVEDFLKSVCEKLDFPLLQLRRFFLRSDVAPVLTKMSKPSVLNGKNVELMGEIKGLFSEITSLIGSIKNYSTRAKIKNGYKFSEPAMKNSKQIALRTSSDARTEIFSVNIVSDSAGTPHFLIRTSTDGENWQNIIVDPKNQVLKEKSINIGRNNKCGTDPIYYSQSELDSPLFSMRLETLKREMEKYKQYLEKEIERLNAYNYRTTTESIGIIDKKSLKLIDSIKILYDNCKRKMQKLANASLKEKFKKQYGIETLQSNPCLILNNINEKGEGIQLGFSSFKNKPCVKIIVIKPNGNPGKCFLIQEDKLIKYDKKELSRSKRTDNATQYHTQEEIDNSGLTEYLLLLKERLGTIPMIKPKKSANA